jgi:hypothetical protein
MTVTAREERVRSLGSRLLPVADDGVELEDRVVLLGGEVPALDVRAQVVGPPQPAALAAPVQPCMHARAAHRILPHSKSLKK